MAPNSATVITKAETDRELVKDEIVRLEIKSQQPTLEIEATKLQIEKAKVLRDRLLEIYQRIVYAAPIDLTPHTAEYNALDDRLDVAIIALMKLQNAQPGHSSTANPQQVKLPEMHLPSFDGKFEDWPSFEDLFSHTIMRNGNLSNAQKLQYLKSCTSGEALNLIKSFTITNSNFNEAWTLLSSRYKNESEIIHSLLKKIFHQRKVKSPTVSELQAILNTTLECIRSLKVLGRATDTWDDMLVFLMLDKLDSDSKSEWAKTLTGTQPPTFLELTDFLEKHIRAIAAKGSMDGPPKQVQQQPQQGQPRNGNRNFRSHHTSSTTQKCVLCPDSHPTFQCPKLQTASQYERFQLIQQANACINCFGSSHQARTCPSKHSCKKCNQKHHTMLHRDQPANKVPVAQQGSSTRAHHAVSVAPETTQVLLKTAIVRVQDATNAMHECRALLDDGSESSFITEAVVCALGLPRSPVNIRVTGLGSTQAAHIKWKVLIRLHSIVYDANIDVEAYVLKKVTGTLPRISFGDTWTHLVKLPLADPTYNQPGKVDILLGADVVASIVRDGLRTGPKNSPTATHTMFGWVLSGRVSAMEQDIVRSHHLTISLDELVQHLWREVQPTTVALMTKDEKLCEEHFQQHVTRDETGRFQVALPFHSSIERPNINNIGETRRLALIRLYGLERRFKLHPEHHLAYKDFMQEYINLGHMTRVGQPRLSATYIPHHFVLKEDSTTTKLRVVFDASMKSSNSISLNSTLMVGLTVQDDLFSILLRFRLHPIALKADIAKMYRQFVIRPEDRDYQRILWRFSTTDLVSEYQLNTVTYGTASAPYLATRCLKQLAIDEAANFPDASAVLLKDMYVDDLLSGASCQQQAITRVQELIRITEAGCMSIRKWCSNDPIVMASIPEKLREDANQTSFDHDDYIKALGIVWQPATDTFTFKTKATETIQTKRQLLSEISKTFDPLGWLSPLSITAKILFQTSWTAKQDWDDKLDEDQLHKWTEYQQQLSTLSMLNIPRCVIPVASSPTILYGFSDASTKAYAACLYLQVNDCNNQPVAINLLAAKSKVSPIHQVSIPRLELLAAVLLCELIELVRRALSLEVPVKCFTDSMIVLKWIQSPSKRWKTYVANRVATIQETVPSEQWQHVPGPENPADLPSRGISVMELVNASMWWHGPTWLATGTSPFSLGCPDMKEVSKEEKDKPVLVHHTTKEKPYLTCWIERFSVLSQLVSATTVLRAFVAWLYSKKTTKPTLFISDRRASLRLLIQHEQSLYYAEDLKQIQKEGQVASTSQLKSLAPVAMSDGLLHVGGRLQNANCSIQKQHPILLHKQFHLTLLIYRQTHHVHLHASISLTVAALRQQYWIMGAKDFVRYHIQRCVPCRKDRAKTMKQMMGQLPTSRVTANRPFLHSGVDCAGPFFIKHTYPRRAEPMKYHFVIFICMSTKAIHLEPVSDMATETFIAAFRRFTSRRGICTHLYSDCGTNFRGAERELQQLHKMLEDQVQHRLANQATTFHYNAPRAPNQGGLWEAGVKTVKQHLRRVMGSYQMTLEQFTTLLCQIEACLNSRPLCALSTDPNDMEALTPGHFLIGCPLTTIPDPSLQHIPTNRLGQWQAIQMATQTFWSRWHNEYLTTLQQRVKWTRKEVNIRVGDLVIITEDNIPPASWRLGRVTEIHPGGDSLVRNATVRFVVDLNSDPVKYSELKRPINKLSVLLGNDDQEVRAGVSCKNGGRVLT